MKSALRLLLALWLAAASTAAAAHPPRGIAVAPDGRVFFSALERIWTIAPGGRMSVARGPSRGHTHELFLDQGGHLWGEETFYDPATRRFRAAIWMRTPEGQISFIYGPTERPTLGAGVFRDRFGCSYQADQTRTAQLLLFRLCPGRPTEALPGSVQVAQAPTRTLLSNIGGAAFGPDGSFYFRRGSIVQRLRSGDRIVTAATGFSAEGFGIAVDARGALCVVEHERSRIVCVGPDGRRSVALASEGDWAPTGVASLGAAIYVLEATRHRAGRPTRYRVRRSEGGRVTLLGITPAGG